LLKEPPTHQPIYQGIYRNSLKIECCVWSILRGADNSIVLTRNNGTMCD
jgi:hypothetical protein